MPSDTTPNEEDAGFNDTVSGLRTWFRPRRGRKRKRKLRSDEPGGFNEAIADLRTGHPPAKPDDRR